MTSKDKADKAPSPPEGMNLLIGWRADGEAPDQNADEPPGPDTAPMLAEIAATQQRILALLEASKPASAAGAELGEAARSIAAATEWTNDIRAAMDSLLVTAGKSIRDLETSERGLAGEVAALKTREEAFDRQIETLAGGARTLGTRLRQLDEARQTLEARSAELQAVKQEIVRYYNRWTSAALEYGHEIVALTKRLDEDKTLAARVEQSIGPWTARIEDSLEENAEAQRQAAAQTADTVQRLTENGDAFLNKFSLTWQGVLEDFRRERRRTRRWSVPVMAAVLALLVPVLPVMGALGQSTLGVFEPYDDTKGWKHIVWDRYGPDVKWCLEKALGSSEPVTCTLEVQWE